MKYTRISKITFDTRELEAIKEVDKFIFIKSGGNPTVKTKKETDFYIYVSSEKVKETILSIIENRIARKKIEIEELEKIAKECESK